MPARVWTRDKLIEGIRELNKQGADLSPSAVQKTHSALFSSARSRSHFGNWRDAVQAAGLDYDQIMRVKQRWNKEEILNQIRACHRDGEDLLHPDFKIKHRNLYLAACAQRYFGSWRRAIHAAGLDYECLREGRVWTKSRIIHTIQSMAREGKSLNWTYVGTYCPGIYRAARRKENFGSWHNALVAAGVQREKHQRGRPSARRLSEAASDPKDLIRNNDKQLDAPAVLPAFGQDVSPLGGRQKSVALKNP